MKIHLVLIDKYKDRNGIDHNVGAITTAYKTVDEATEVYMKWRDAVKSQDSEIHWDFAIVQKISLSSMVFLGEIVFGQ